MAKAPIGKRIVAYLIDAVLITIIALIIGVAGGVIMALIGAILGKPGLMMLLLFPLYGVIMLISLAFTLFRDGLNGGRSYGKKFMGLKVVVGDSPCSKKDSLKRNITFLAGIIPILGFLVVLLELLMPIIDGEGKRFGDKFAGTQVVEA